MTRLVYLLILVCSNIQAQQLDVFDIARNGTAELARNLLKTDPQVFNTVNSEGFSPLILACYRKNNEVAKVIIANNGDINLVSPMGTALMASVVKSNLEIAQLLLEKNADLNAIDKNKTTALIYAVQFKNAEMVKLLLKHKADKTLKDSNGKTAFEYAAFSGNQEIIDLLKN